MAKTTKTTSDRSASGVAPADFNSRFVGNGLVVQRGEGSVAFMPTTFRAIEESVIMAAGKTRSLPRFLNLMVDKRAPGMWAGVVGGPKSKVEHLAELAVDADVIAEIADTFADVNLMRLVNDKLLRGNQRYKAGVFTIDYPALLRAVGMAVGASSSVRDTKWIVARVVAELLSRAYAKLNVMVPFVGAAELSWHMRPIATLGDILRASKVATVTEVFEAIELGSGFDASKEFNPAVAEAMIGPLLSAAANRLSNCLRYDKYMRDTAVLTGQKLACPGMLPEHMQDNPDLVYLASNASFALGAIEHARDPIMTPDFDLRDAVAYTVMRLREMKRFETWSMERFASYYSVELVKARTGYVAGAVVQRHDPFKINAQVTRFVERGDIVMQMESNVGEAYVAPLAEAVNRAFEGDSLNRNVAVAAQHLIVTAFEQDGAGDGGYVFTHGVTADEERMLGLAHSEFLTLIGIDEDDDTATPQIVMEVPDLKMFYNSKGQPTAAGIMTTDPLEILILRGIENSDAAPFPLRPQTILDDIRRVVLSQIPETFKIDGVEVNGLIDLSKPVKIELPMLGDIPVVRSESLQDLLGLLEIGPLHLTVEQSAANTLSGSFAAMVAIYNDLTANGETGKLLARQVAVATHSMLGKVVNHSAFQPMVRTMLRRFVHDPAFKGRHAALRAHLQEAFVRHQLALNTCFMMLLKLGLLEFGVHEDLVKMFEAENVVEVAITAETWQSALSTR